MFLFKERRRNKGWWGVGWARKCEKETGTDPERRRHVRVVRGQYRDCGNLDRNQRLRAEGNAAHGSRWLPAKGASDGRTRTPARACGGGWLLHTSDAADEEDSVDLG